MAISEAQLKSLLVEPGLVPAEQFEAAAADAREKVQPLDELLVERDLIPDHYLGQLVADALGHPFVRLENLSILDHVLRTIPEPVARRSRAVAFGMDDAGRVRVAMRDPDDLELIRMVEKKMGVRVAPFYVTERGVQAGLEHYSKDIASAVASLLAEKPADDGENSRVARVVDLIMNYAYQNNASDVHIEPREKEIIVRYRIDGVLHDVVAVPHDYLEPLVTRVKALSKMDADGHDAAREGKFQEIFNNERVDVRVSVLPVVDGERVVLRLLTEKGKRFTLRDLGFSERDLKIIDRQMQKSFGMILATGPIGSGKTTTVYAILKALNTRDVNIATIEDPIEYAIDGVNQIQVNAKTGLTFASGLRSIVRQDPDIIMVGELRDEDTASHAMNAAMTGHLVLSTLHNNDAAPTLSRLREMKVEPFVIASSVNVIVAQKLVRKICPRCIVSYEVSLEDLKEKIPEALVGKFFSQSDAPLELYRGKGCVGCNHTGYQGRIGIFEVLEMEDNIRDLIMKNAPVGDINAQAVKNGMTSIFEDGIRKALGGQTTIDEVLRVAGLI